MSDVLIFVDGELYNGVHTLNSFEENSVYQIVVDKQTFLNLQNDYICEKHGNVPHHLDCNNNIFCTECLKDQAKSESAYTHHRNKPGQIDEVSMGCKIVQKEMEDDS
jgi:hypothetical protein